MRVRILLLAALLLPGALQAALVEGRVVSGESPLAGVRVEAHSTLDYSGPPVAVSGPSAADGSYRMDLPEGLYAFFARDADRGLFAFCGQNPVAVGGESVWVGLQAIPFRAPERRSYDNEYAGAVEGVVLFEGAPLEGAYLSLYLDVAEDLKGQGYRLSPPTGPDGRFAFDDLPESGYFLVARKRQGGGRVGPVREGDHLAVFGGNPLAVRAGESIRVVLEAVAKVRPASGAETLGRVTGNGFRGMVTDAAGKPVAGMHVFAYTDRVIGHQRPAALSAPTGPDGRFEVHLPEPGTYFVGARRDYGDSPAPGEPFGLYDATADHGLAIPPGTILEGIRIVVEPINLQ